jgi:MFS family permease
MPAFSALITESLPSKRRGAAFGAYRMITMMPRVVTVFLGGVIMDSLGIWEGTRMVLIAVIFAVIIMIVLRYKFITETLSVKERSEAKEQSWKESILELRNQSRTVWAMLSVSCISSFALRLSLPFMVLYAINVIGLSTTEWGVIGSIIGIISMSLSFPGGLISDRIGRKPNILLARILSPITTFGMTLARGFNETLLVRIVSSIGGGLGGGVGGGSGGPAWRALLADVIPARRRGRVFGLMGTFTGMVGAPASWIGGYLWDNYNPDIAFQMSCGLGIIPIFILLFFVKEPKVKEK